MTSDLYRLSRAAHPLIDDAFLKGDRNLSKGNLRAYLSPVEAEVDLEAIDERIQEIRDDDDIDPQDSEIDAELAPTVHRSLALSRHQAADPGLWHYLCVVRFPDFVHYRWDHVYNPEKPDNMREKFLKAGADIYSNALHRLWWAAELTYEEAESGDPDDRDYDRTRQALEFQELANDVFDRWFSRYKPVAIACVDLLSRETLRELEESGEYDDPPSKSDVVSDTTTLLREELTVRRVEAMEPDQIEEMIRDLRDRVMARDVEG